MLDYANNTAQPIAADIDIVDHQITTDDGTLIRARWYRQPASDRRAAVLYLHGGGMILGSVPIFDGPVSRYVAHTGVPMLSIDYPLAPEHPHPTPVEDAYAGLVWLADVGVDGSSTGEVQVSGVELSISWLVVRLTATDLEQGGDGDEVRHGDLSG